MQITPQKTSPLMAVYMLMLTEKVRALSKQRCKNQPVVTKKQCFRNGLNTSIADPIASISAKN